MLHKNLTSKIISAAYRVFNILGFGFLEKSYELAYAIECRKTGLSVKNQHPIQVFYENQQIGNYFADLLINDTVIVECKAIKKLDNIHYAQLLHYLRATHLKVGLLVNFGAEELQVKRMVL